MAPSVLDKIMTVSKDQNTPGGGSSRQAISQGLKSKCGDVPANAARATAASLRSLGVCFARCFLRSARQRSIDSAAARFSAKMAMGQSALHPRSVAYVSDEALSMKAK